MRRLGPVFPVPALSTVARTDPPNGAVIPYLGKSWPNHSAGLAHSIQYNAASDVWRFEVQQGDRAYFDATPATRERSEISGQYITMENDKEFFWPLIFFIENGSSPGTGPAGEQPIFGQWHDTGDANDAGGMPPPIAVIWTGTKMRCQLVYSEANPFVAGSFTAQSFDLGEVKTGRWVVMLFAIKFATLPGLSRVRCWQDGVLVLDREQKLSTPNVAPNYAKQGIYRFTTPGACAVRQRIMLPTFEDISWLINAPPPRFRL